MLSYLRLQNIKRLRGGLFLTSASYSTIAQKFENSKIKSKTLTEDPGNDMKLKMYALFKQGSEGPVQTKRPGMTDFVGRAKWDAWKAIEDISKEQAQQSYSELIDKLAGDEFHNQSAPIADYKYMIVEMDGGIRKVTLNRPNKKNALLFEFFEEWMKVLDEAAADPKTVLTVFSGAGDYFSAGIDLSNFTGNSGDRAGANQSGGESVVHRFVAKHIEYPKPLVAIVNGPAFGIAVTILAHFDLVYASDRATFVTPFSQLGIVSEGCSSLLFPSIMGHSKACEMLLFNKKITAKEAFNVNFVTEVFEHDTLYSSVWQRLQSYAELPKGSLIVSKKNISLMNKDQLHEINKLETEELAKVFSSGEFVDNIKKHFASKRK